MSNSNFNITKVTVDPVSQEISSLEVNGKPIETGGANLEYINENITENGEYTFEPSEGYDGFSSVDLTVNIPIIGPDALRSIKLTQCDEEGNDIEDPSFKVGIAYFTIVRPSPKIVNLWIFKSWNTGDEEPSSSNGTLTSFTATDIGTEFIYLIDNKYYRCSYYGI